MRKGSHQLEYRQAGLRRRRTAHWWFLCSLIAVGAMIAFLKGTQPAPGRPEYHISNYLSDQDLLFVRITVICLAVVWCGLLIAFLVSLRRRWSAARYPVAIEFECSTARPQDGWAAGPIPWPRNVTVVQ